jgi:hypothetical protein
MKVPIVSETTYARRMSGDGMDPVIRAGELLLINPLLPIMPGGLALFLRTDGPSRIGECIGSDSQYWYLRVYGDKPREIKLARAEWPTGHKIYAIIDDRKGSGDGDIATAA